MKFARYLKDSQAPEWKKAYLDYRLLKKRITAIRKAKSGLTESPLDSQEEFNEPKPRSSDISNHQGETIPLPELEGHDTSRQTVQSGGSRIAGPVPQDDKSSASRSREGFRRRISTKQLATPLGRRLSLSSANKGKKGAYPREPFIDLPLRELMEHLTSQERAFFAAVDDQFDKIESFYVAREREMALRSKVLHEQLDELRAHKRCVQAAHPSHATASRSSELFANMRMAVRRKIHRMQRNDQLHGKELEAKGDNMGKAPVKLVSTLEAVDEKGKGKAEDGSMVDDEKVDNRNLRLLSDPEEYAHAKKRLKKAVLEHYRGLEVLHNYRVLNITGFRKALKKFEKLTKIPVQNQYMVEKIDKSAFASDKMLRSMMMDIETIYASVFAHGDRKRALDRLRATYHARSHHFSMFRSGIYLGLAIPALVAGIYESFRRVTRTEIPGYGALLYIYGFLLVPTLFSLLVGLDLLAWARSRINYTFIFELDTKTRMDHREYYEVPSLLLTTLCYAFWLSFARVGYPLVSPTIWPLVWLGFTAVVVFDPLPLQYKTSRYWLLRSTAKLFTAGTRRIEFTDFWLGDQFCSLTFPLSSLSTFICIYATDFDSHWAQKCGASATFWPASWAVGSIPFWIRLIQSIRRYYDSGLVTHLINGGKYASGITSLLFLYLWRHNGIASRGAPFVLFVIASAVYATYASAWDLVMDWSLLRPHTRYPFLREELIYTNAIYAYYLAIIYNVAVRFIWVFYIPKAGPNVMLRFFIGGMLEMTRRCVWNFFRLENEHIGNMDQYRITREVPLPYHLDDAYGKDDDDDDDDEGISSGSEGTKAK